MTTVMLFALPLDAIIEYYARYWRGRELTERNERGETPLLEFLADRATVVPFTN